MKRTLLLLLSCIILLCPALTVNAGSADHTYTADEVEDLFGGIAAYKCAACGASDTQEWIDTGLCAEAGTVAEFYAITLSQSGDYDFSRYEQALLGYLDTHEVYSATTREKYALALLACGSTDGYIRRVCDSDIGGLGLMSLVFGLHLLNNGCTSALYTTDALIREILCAALPDGGWAVIGQIGDVDVTSMVVQSLAPYYGTRSDVTQAIDSALELLSARQLESGGFKSMGRENCESAAQVLTALSALGIDQNTDPRFIKNGHTVLGAMLSYRNADGSFSHTGGDRSENAVIQAFYAARAYLRVLYGQGPLYLLDRRDEPVIPDEPSPTQASQPTQKPPAEATAAPAPTNAPPTQSPTQQTTPTADTTEPPSSAPSDAPPTAYETESDAAQASEQAETAPASPDEATPRGPGYKLYAVIGILGAAAVVCAVLLLRKKRGIKRYLAVLILAAAAILFVLLTNFESRESYARVAEKTNPAGEVTMTISCAVLAGEDDLPDAVPDDGLILPETVFTISEGENAYDLLLEASRRFDIRIDNRGSDSSAYIAGIQYVYEYQYGSLSGWMFRVNGEFPDVGCQGYTLSDGDRVEWLYTRDIGKDLR